MKIQTILFGWSVAALLCPSLLTAQQGSAVVEVAQPARRVINHQEVIPTPISSNVEAQVSPSYEPVPVVVAQPPSVASSCGNGCCQKCQSRQTCQRRCGPLRCGTQGNGYQYQSAATPFGNSTRQILETQISKGAEAQMVFYHLHFMFRNGQWQLSPAGHVHCETVCGLMNKLPGSPYVLVEATGHSQVDELKKQLVVEQLNAHGCWIQAGQVRAGKPNRLGISGPEALIIYQDRLRRMGRSSLGTGGSSIGSFSGNSSFGGTSGGSSSGISSTGFGR